MPEYILFLAKLREERRKAFYEWASIDLSSKLFLTCRGSFNHYKSVHHLIPTLPLGIGNTQTIFKTNQKALLSIECPQVMFSSGSNWRGEESLFCRVQEGDHIVRLPSRASGCHRWWKSLTFCQIWNIPTISLFFVRRPYK